MIEFQAVFTIARQELTVNTRNRWTMIFAVIFSLLVLAISYFGLLTAGASGFQGFTRTSVSLLNLVMYLIPLVCLVVGTMSFTGEKNTSELLFAQPVSRGSIWLGKLLGLFASVFSATAVGFGIGGVVIAMRAGSSGIWAYPVFVGFSLLLALAFLSLSALVAALCQRKNRAFGVIMFLWFFFVLFYDLLVMGATFFFREHVANQLILVSLFGNPVALARVASLIVLDGKEIFGVAGAALLRFLGGDRLALLVLVAGLIVWAVGPFLLSQRVLDRQDI